MIEKQYDLLVKGARVIDPAQHLDGIRDIAVKGGRIAELSEGVPVDSAHTVVDATQRVVTPGLVDLHTHVFAGLAVCIEADPLGAKSGVTTMVDAGSAGAATFAVFRDHIISTATTRILPFLNIWLTGAATMALPCQPTWTAAASMPAEDAKQLQSPDYTDDLRFASVDEAMRVALANRDRIAGIKVWVNCFTGGTLEPVLRAKKVAEALGLPVMVCAYFAPPKLSEIVSVLNAGDIQTHCYGGFTDLVDEKGRIHPAILAARDRGVVFDVGHGAGSFDFSVARRALDAGFPPDTISTDIHAQCINGPTYDLPTTMSKFLALGMSLHDVIRATTARPAEVLHMENDIGSLGVGMPADIAIFELSSGKFDLVDVKGEHVVGNRRLLSTKTIRAGSLLD